jgi:hypothetical protein
MKRAILLAALLLVVAAPMAMAAGSNISWATVCWTQSPISLQTFACNVNSSTAAYQWPLTLSFKIDSEMTDMVGIEFTLEGQSEATDMPDWWKVGDAVTDCRVNMMTFASDMTGVADETCVDWTAGQAFNVFGYTWDTNRGHIIAGTAISADVPFDMMGDVEYYAGQFKLKNSKTVGTGACTGCGLGYVIGNTLLTIAGLSGRRDDLYEPLAGGNQCLWWQNTTVPCNGVPTRPSITWGQVKNLYR